MIKRRKIRTKTQPLQVLEAELVEEPVPNQKPKSLIKISSQRDLANADDALLTELESKIVDTALTESQAIRQLEISGRRDLAAQFLDRLTVADETLDKKSSIVINESLGAHEPSERHSAVSLALKRRAAKQGVTTAREDLSVTARDLVAKVQEELRDENK